MNVLVIGCGRLGRALAEMLDDNGHDVAVIDSNADSFHFLSEDFNGMTVTGVPMDMNVLRAAGIEGCDAVAVVTPDDNLNITVSQVAGEFFGVQNVVARISDPAREEVFHSFGLKTVCHTKLTSNALFTALTQPWEAKHISFGASTAAFHTRTVEKPLVGVNVSMVPVEDGEIVFGVAHGDGSMELYREDRRIVLQAGDKIVIAKVVD